MAKAPKTPARKTPARAKPASKTKTPVEDAVVIEETPSEAEKPGSKVESAESAVAAEPQDKTVDEGGDSKVVEPEAESPPEPDTVEPAAEEPPKAPAPVATPKGSSRTGAFFGFLLGGVAAAAIGFGAGWYLFGRENPLEPLVTSQGQEISNLAGEAETLSGRIGALEADTAVSDLKGELTARLDGMDGTLTDIGARLDDFSARLAAVEKLAPEGSAAAQMAAEAYDRELQALREMFQGELAKVEAAQADATGLQEQAAEAAQAASGRAALARVTSALDTGAPFADVLADLSASTGITVPQALSDVAEKGAPTLATLQDSFPQAARAALDASVRAGVESGEVSRFSAFLQTQLGTRSLEPKEGDDADAVLSRAEAALRQGDIGAALTELDALPEAGQPAIADWRAAAGVRKAALDAAGALANELNAK